MEQNLSPYFDLTNHLFPPPEYAIIGAGVAGLTTAALLEKAGVPYVVLEKHSKGSHLAGADVVLYPGAITILDELGIHKDFWYHCSSAVQSVHLCRPRELINNLKDLPLNNITKASPQTHALPVRIQHSILPIGRSSCANTVRPLGQRISLAGDVSVLDHVQASISTLTPPPPIKSINMEHVVGGQQLMRITNRRRLMIELQKLVPESKIIFDASVLQLTEHSSHIEVIFTYQCAFATCNVPVVIGADGVKSACRLLIQGEDARPPRYSGEICYRGSFVFSKEEKDPVCRALKRQLEDLFIKQDFQMPSSLPIYLSTERRTSWGFLNEAGTVGFWWVREIWSGTRAEFAQLQEKQPDKADWPEPLRSMYMLTQAQDFYVQPIVDREHDKDSRAWHSQRCVLIGDAAHPSTPALFQGANLAIEDAHLLVNILRRFDTTVPLETLFSKYARQRMKHVVRIQKISFKQTKLSQLSSGPSMILRDAALKMIPARFFEKKLRKTTQWDPREAVREVTQRRPACVNCLARPSASTDSSSCKSMCSSSVKSFCTAPCTHSISNEISKEVSFAALEAATAAMSSKADSGSSINHGTTALPQRRKDRESTSDPSSPATTSSIITDCTDISVDLGDLMMEDARSSISEVSRLDSSLPRTTSMGCMKVPITSSSKREDSAISLPHEKPMQEGVFRYPAPMHQTFSAFCATPAYFSMRLPASDGATCTGYPVTYKRAPKVSHASTHDVLAPDTYVNRSK